MAPFNQPLRSGVLLVGHGTRDAEGTAATFELAALVQKELDPLPVETCFLEITQPNIEQGIARLVNRGACQITALPLMLFAAGHVKQDIPAATRQAIGRHPNVSVQVLPHLGSHGAILQLSADRYRSAVDESAISTRLVLVGRGSRDAEAIAEMHRFAEQRAELTPVEELDVCFLAMAEPKLAEGLARAAASQAQRIVVQPHLLFPGELLAKVRSEVHAFAQRYPQQWIVAPPLGVDRLIVEAITQLAQSEAKSFSGVRWPILKLPTRSPV